MRNKFFFNSLKVSYFSVVIWSLGTVVKFKVYISIYILHSYISGCYVGIDSHFIFSILPFVWVNNTLTSCQTFCWLGNITGWCCGGRMWLNFVGTANIPSWFPDLIIVITVQCTMCFYWGPDVPLIFFDYFLLILPPTTMGDQCWCNIW